MDGRLRIHTRRRRLRSENHHLKDLHASSDNRSDLQMTSLTREVTSLHHQRHLTHPEYRNAKLGRLQAFVKAG